MNNIEQTTTELIEKLTNFVKANQPSFDFDDIRNDVSSEIEDHVTYYFNNEFAFSDHVDMYDFRYQIKDSVEEIVNNEMYSQVEDYFNNNDQVIESFVSDYLKDNPSFIADYLNSPEGQKLILSIVIKGLTNAANG